MEPQENGPTPASDRSKRRNITERTRALLFLLREIPYITLQDIRRYFFPGARSRSYCLELNGVLLRNRLIAKHPTGDGTWIYYLTEYGRRIVEFFLQDRPRYNPKFRTFYYSLAPRKASEVNPFFFFPTPRIGFTLFTPHRMHAHPFQHTRSLLELFYLLRNAYRFLFVLWLDQVDGKKQALNLPCHPDILLTNDLATEAGRIYVELENSSKSLKAVVERLNHLTTAPADWYIFLCTSEDILLNLGRSFRKILLGEAKVHHNTLFFTPRAQGCLYRNVLMGHWRPSWRNDGQVQRLKDLTLYRYDHEVFDRRIWMKDPEAGSVKAASAGEPISHSFQVVPYTARKPGRRNLPMGEILDGYAETFRLALDKSMAGGTIDPGSVPGAGGNQ
jgi:hypothetical protein